MTKKFFAILIFAIILFSYTGVVSAEEGDTCCLDGECGGMECLCTPDPLPAGWGGPGSQCDHSNTNTQARWGRCYPAGSIVFCPTSKYLNLVSLIGAITGWLFNVSMIVFPIMIVVSAIVFMTAAGRPEKIKLARRIIFWTIIGFLFILFSKGLENLIEYIIGKS